MIAKIRDKKGNFYNSYILAIKYNGWSSEAIVFDESKKFIKLISYWHPKRKIFIVDYKMKDWITKGKWQGYKWLLEDRKTMRDIVGGFLMNRHSISIEKIPQAKGLAVDIDLPVWNKISSQTDIDALMEVSFGFHDGTLDSSKYDNGILEVVFNCWNGKTVLRCSNELEYNLNELGLIFSVAFEIVEDKFEWLVDCGDSDDWLYGADKGKWFIKAKNIEWQFIIET